MLLDSRESRKRIASFQGLRHGNLAISSQQSRQKTTLAQWVRNSSRATSVPNPGFAHRVRQADCGLRVQKGQSLVPPLIPKFVSERTAGAYELRNRGARSPHQKI